MGGRRGDRVGGSARDSMVDDMETNGRLDGGIFLSVEMYDCG